MVTISIRQKQSRLRKMKCLEDIGPRTSDCEGRPLARPTSALVVAPTLHSKETLKQNSGPAPPRALLASGTSACLEGEH